MLFNNYDDTGYLGNSSFDRRHVFNFYYIYDLPFYREQNGVVGKLLGGWQISGATFMRTGTPLWVTEGADIAGTGDTFGNPWNLNGDPKSDANEEFSAGATDGNYWFNPEVFSRPAAGTFGNAPRNDDLQPGPVPVGHCALQERQHRRNPRDAVPLGVLQLHQPRELVRRQRQRRRRGPTPTPRAPPSAR